MCDHKRIEERAPGVWRCLDCHMTVPPPSRVAFERQALDALRAPFHIKITNRHGETVFEEFVDEAPNLAGGDVLTFTIRLRVPGGKPA